MMARAHGIFSIVVTAALLVAATGAVALDDGGGRSVFAIGAGNRALGLGGAYSAVADDASALIWNPGALGLIPRKQVQISQTTLFGLGFNEQFGGIVLPSWRYGTTSLVFRRFGVDGIEQRSDRGVLLDDNLSDIEMEIALGYGHAVGSWLSLGGSIKLQRQKLAGYSGSGVGVDIGLLAQPLTLFGVRETGRGLTLGVVVRNLVEPSVRLDEDGVPDPRGLRIGLAYPLQIGDSASLLGTVDLEKTADMDSRLHAGCEVEIMRLLALRVGSHAGDLTAGAGVTWQSLGFDYQYEDNPLDGIHRFGLSVAFGPTVAESRQQARQAEAAALQTHLDAVFDERSRAQADRVAADARQSLEARRWDEALDLAGTLSVLAPEDPRVADLMAGSWQGRGRDQKAAGDLTAAAVSFGRALTFTPDNPELVAELNNVRAESARRAERSRELRQRFEGAMDAFARDDLMAARAGFRGLLRLAPDDPEAATMLRRTEEAIARRAAIELEQAGSDLAAGRLDAAAARLASARSLAPETPGLTAAETELKRARRELQRREAAAERAAAAAAAAAAATSTGPAQPEPMSEARQRELADLYQRGARALEAGRTDDAIRYWELVWNAWPEFEGVRDHLAQEYLTLGMEAFAAGQLREAVDHWEQALRVAPDDERARGYLDRAHQQLERMERISGRR